MNIFKNLYYRYFTKRIIKEHIDYKRDKFEDRNVLETIIFPTVLSGYNPKTILDIGREDYQHFYNEFFQGRELWTLDYDPKRKEFGASRHITDNVANLKKHFQNDYFDFILMNGVFGWGLDDKNDINKTFNAILDILKPGGVFILGYNDAPMPLMDIKALSKLKPLYFKPLKGTNFQCVNGDHKYNFYIKK